MTLSKCFRPGYDQWLHPLLWPLLGRPDFSVQCGRDLPHLFSWTFYQLRFPPFRLQKACSTQVLKVLGWLKSQRKFSTFATIEKSRRAKRMKTPRQLLTTGRSTVKYERHLSSQGSLDPEDMTYLSYLNKMISYWTKIKILSNYVQDIIFVQLWKEKDKNIKTNLQHEMLPRALVTWF